MKNIEMTRKADKLIITIDVSDKVIKAASMSASGKSKIIATTSGNVAVEGGLNLGLNLYQRV